jgi:spermidine synthase
MTVVKASSAARDSLRGESFIFLAVGVLGLSSVITQLALMREMLGAFSGNEMVLGIILGNWLLLTGIGAALGRVADRLRSRRSATLQSIFAAGLILIAVMPLAQVYLLRTLRDVVFVRGALVGVTETVTASFVLLLPYCIVSGFLLTLACAIASSPRCVGAGRGGDAAPTSTEGIGASGIGRVYVADSVGSIIGGALFSFVLVRWLDHFAMLYLPALLNLGMAGLLAWHCTRSDRRIVGHEKAQEDTKRGTISSIFAPLCAFLWQLIRRRWLLSGVAAGLVLGVMALMLRTDMDAVSTAKQFAGQKIVFRKNSPYGKLIVTESAGQFDFIENGLPIISTHNVEQVEETVHYAMAQRPDARKVLLVSGGVSGTAREILKYDVNEVTYVELDPLIIEAGRKYLPDSLADPRIKVVNTDGRLFVKRVGRDRRARRGADEHGRPGGPSLPGNEDDGYGVVIVDVLAPSTSQINRFYTAEFYSEIKRVLGKEGVIAFSLGRYENYVSKELAQMLASANATLKQSFRNVLVVPGGRVFFLASDGELFPDIAARIEQRRIPTQLVNRHYLDAMLTPDRMTDMQRATAQPAVVSRDFSPILYYYHLMHWMSQFKVRFGVLGTALLVALAVYLFTIRPVPLAIFVSGFAASALEVVLLLGFQILYGSVYGQLGIIVTMFMAGLAVGAWVGNRGLTRNDTNPHPDPLPSRKGEGSSSPPPSGERINPALSGIKVRGPAQNDKLKKLRSLAALAFAIAGLSVLLPLVLMALGRLSGTAVALVAVRATIALLTFVLAMLVGMEFPIASQVEFDGASATASRLYTADFVGASLGALLASTFLIPLIGVTAVCLLTAGLNVIGGAVVLLRKR